MHTYAYIVCVCVYPMCICIYYLVYLFTIYIHVYYFFMCVSSMYSVVIFIYILIRMWVCISISVCVCAWHLGLTDHRGIRLQLRYGSLSTSFDQMDRKWGCPAQPRGPTHPDRGICGAVSTINLINGALNRLESWVSFATRHFVTVLDDMHSPWISNPNK